MLLCCKFMLKPTGPSAQQTSHLESQQAIKQTKDWPKNENNSELELYHCL